MPLTPKLKLITASILNERLKQEKQMTHDQSQLIKLQITICDLSFPLKFLSFSHAIFQT